MKRLLVLGLALATIAGVSAQNTTVKADLSSAARLADWTLDGSGGWEIADGKLILSKAGVPAGPIRRPAAIAILKSPPFGKLTLEVDMRSTAPVDLLVRDVQLIFGYESPTRFYYVHLAAKTDAVHNGIFIVDNADRRRIDDGKGVPQMPDLSWRRVRLERDPESGRIDIFTNGSAKPVLSANDTTIRSGRVGVGSFDETGEFRNISVTGVTR